MERDELAFAGVVRQAELVRAGEVSSRELVELYLERIERLDPELNTFRKVMAERALVDAQQADGRRGAGDARVGEVGGVGGGLSCHRRTVGRRAAPAIGRMPYWPSSPCSTAKSAAAARVETPALAYT